MLISLIPAVSAGTDKSGITVKYRPWGPDGVLKQETDSYPLTNFTSYDNTLGFWRYVKSSNNKDTTKVIRNNIEVFSLYNYGGKDGWVAFAINVPVAGDYDVTLDWWKYPGTVITEGAMYIAPVSVELDSVTADSHYLVTDEIKYTAAKTMTVKNWNFPAPGEYYVVYKALTEDNKNFMFPGVLTLNGGSGSVAMGVKVSLDTAEIAVEGTAQASATVYMSDEETNTNVTYSSSDTSVATVDKSTGIITGVAEGTATITATYTDAKIGEVKGTTEVEVIAKENSGVTIKYRPWGPNGVLKPASDKYPLTNYKTYDAALGFWRYVEASNGVDTNKVIRTNTEVFSLYNYGGKDGWVAFAINVPVAGDYDVTLDWWKYTGTVITEGAMYIAPVSVELDSVTADSHYLVTDEIKYTAANTMTVENWNFPAPGEYYVVYKALTEDNKNFMLPGVLTLNGGSGSVAMSVDVSAPDVAVGAESQASSAVYLSDETVNTSAEITYSSSDSRVATVDEKTGVITGVAEGTATITATYTDAKIGEVKGKAEVKVTEVAGAGLKVKYNMHSAGEQTYFKDLTTYKNTNGFWRFADASNGPESKYVNKTWNSLYISSYGGVNGWVALEINVPVAGYYNLSFEYLQTKDGTSQGAMYIAPSSVDLGAAINNSDYLVTNIINYNGASSKMNTMPLGTRHFPTAGKYYVIYKGLVDTNPMFPGSITLDGGGDGVAPMYVAADAEKNEIEVSEKVKINAIVYMSDASSFVDDTVLFSSSDDGVAAVTQKGVVTGISSGTATISVTGGVADAQEEISITVFAPVLGKGEIVYDMTPEGFANSTKLNTITYAETDNTWQYFSDYNGSGKYLTLNTSYGYLYLAAYGGYNGWVALKIRVPEAGKYGINLTSGKRLSGASKVGMYILPGDTARGQISALTAAGTGLVTDEINCYATSNTKATESYVGTYNFKEAGEYIVVYKQLSNDSGTNMYIGDIRLDASNIISEIDLTVDEAQINWNDKTNLYAIVRRLDKSVMGEDEYKISFESSNVDIADISKDGTITGTGDGNVVISATATDGTRTVVKKISLSVFDHTGVVGTFIDVPAELYQREAAKIDFRVLMNSKNAYAIPFENVSFTVEPEGIVTINDGIITAVADACGEVTITGEGLFHGEMQTFEKTITVIEDDGKSDASYFTAEKRAAAKENAEKYTWAKDIVKSAVKLGDDAIDAAMYLYYHVPGEGVPRGRHVGTPNDPDYNRCRYCGVNIAEQYGDWAIDAYNRPWKVQCLGCKRLFPSNDFESFLKLGQDELGRFDVNRARKAHHEKFVCEDVKNGEACECVAPSEEYSDAWYEFYGYGLPGGYLYNDLYSELRTESNEMYNKDPYKKDKSGNNLVVDGARWGVDDGWGYLPGREAEPGMQERCGYIGMYHYRMWYQVSAQLNRLKDAYVYTGDIEYGRAGAILLDRVADIYPEYDIYPYREYFLNSHGGSHIGSIQGRINDTSFAKAFSEAADAFYSALTDPQVIKFLSERAAEYNLQNDKSSSKKIWNNWETNILEHIFELSKRARLNGNYGMNQEALAIAAIALDKEPETTDMIEWIYQSGTQNGSGNTRTLSGGNFASQVVDDVDRDGMGDESGPNYNFLWLSRLMGMANFLAEYKGKGDFNPYENAKFIQMFVAPTRIVLTENHHVQVGDSGGTASLEFKSDKQTALKGFMNIEDERVRKILAQYIYMLNGYTEKGLNYGIFEADPERAEKEILAYVGEKTEPVSEMLTGYGFAVLRDGKKYTSANAQTAKNNMRDFWMYFGNANSHAHYDALTFGMETYGINVAPDLGYPETTDTDPNRLQWVQATISHNTVVVDEKDQASNKPNAEPMHFDSTDAVKLMDVSAPDAYPQTENYRRSLVMIKVNDDVSYGVDFFRVTGGEKHTYSFHSQAENAIPISGLEMTPDPVVQDKDGKDIVGSYAGADVPFGKDPDTVYEWFYETRYPRGYTWMRRPRRDNSPVESFAVEFDVEDYNKSVSGGSDVTLRMTQINNFTPDEVAIVAGYVPQKKDNLNLPETLDYVLTQRYADPGESLDSLFTTVFEPYKGERYIENIEAVVVSGNVPDGEMVRAVKLTHSGGNRTDYVVYATDNSETYTVKDTNGEAVFTFRGFVGVYSINAEGTVLYRYVNDGDIINGAEDEPTGSVTEYTGTVAGCTEELSLDNYIDVNMQCDDLASLSGKYIYVDNDGKQNAVYRIDGAAPSPNEDGTIRLDIGMISPIRGHKNTQDVNAGYVYNIASEQTFRIPMSYSEDYSPIISPVSDSLTVSAGSSIKVNVSAESPMTENAPEISYIGSTLPRGASVNSATGEITWKPDASQVGENHFAITARDADGRESTVHFYIEVYGSTTGKPSDKTDNAETPTTDNSGNAGGGGGGGGGGGAPTDKPDDETKTDETDTGEASGDTEGGERAPDASIETDVIRFTDLSNHEWAADAINTLADDGIIRGTTSDTYSPGHNITRADFASLLVRAFKLTSDNTENFADVSASDYFAAELAIARNTGIVNGIGDNRFAPRNTITRQDMMVIVHRALQTLDVGLGVYDEPQNADYATVAEYAKPAVTALIGANLVNGKSGRIAPTDYTTRAEVAVLIKRILDFIK